MIGRVRNPKTGALATPWGDLPVAYADPIAEQRENKPAEKPRIRVKAGSSK